MNETFTSNASAAMTASHFERLIRFIFLFYCLFYLKKEQTDFKIAEGNNL